MSAKIEFAKIDARDDVNTRYSPVAFCSPEGDGPVELGPRNGKIALTMNREYLVRLHELQQEIRGKYLPSFDDRERPTPAGTEWDLGMDEKQYNEAKAEAEGRFPGDEAPYYT